MLLYSWVEPKHRIKHKRHFLGSSQAAPFLYVSERKASGHISYLIKLASQNEKDISSSRLGSTAYSPSQGFFPLCFIQRLALLWLGGASEANPILTLLKMNKRGGYCIFTPEKRCINSSIRNIKLQEVFCAVALLGRDEGSSFITGRKACSGVGWWCS